MFCKVCNTRIDEGARACPNCGAHGTASGRKSSALSEPGPSAKLAPHPDPEDLDLELDEVLEEAGVEPSGEREPRAGARPAQETQPIVPSLDLDPVGLRKQLAERPEMLEPELRVFTDEDDEPVGAGYATAVGPIDLLARDVDGKIVIVMVAERNQGPEIVAEMLQRVGWVRKHLAHPQQPPRGIVLFESLPENLGYAAAAVTDTIAFKTYRVTVAFDAVDF